jgi:hypothetical protein
MAEHPDTSPDPDPLAALLDHLDGLPADLAAWATRSPDPDAGARRAASRAVDAVDGALAALHQIRAALIGEIRTSDDANAARVDRLLAEWQATALPAKQARRYA